jgi:hypothetical protein
LGTPHVLNVGFAAVILDTSTGSFGSIVRIRIAAFAAQTKARDRHTRQRDSQGGARYPL